MNNRYRPPRLENITGYVYGEPSNRQRIHGTVSADEYKDNLQTKIKETGLDYEGHMMACLINSLLGEANSQHETDLYQVAPFCWCEELECKYCGHDAPLFIWKPTDIRVWFYKHPRRCLESNRQYTALEVVNMAVSIWNNPKIYIDNISSAVDLNSLFEFL